MCFIVSPERREYVALQTLRRFNDGTAWLVAVLVAKDHPAGLAGGRAAGSCVGPNRATRDLFEIPSNPDGRSRHDRPRSFNQNQPACARGRDDDDERLAFRDGRASQLDRRARRQNGGSLCDKSSSWLPTIVLDAPSPAGRITERLLRAVQSAVQATTPR